MKFNFNFYEIYSKNIMNPFDNNLEIVPIRQNTRRSQRLKDRITKIENDAADEYFKNLRENKQLMSEVLDGPLPFLRFWARPPPNVDWENMLLHFKRIPKPLSSQTIKHYQNFVLKCSLYEQQMPIHIRRDYCKILMKEV